MSSKKIEELLLCHTEFKISRTFGHDFVDFNIRDVGKTFENLIGNEEMFIPSLDVLYSKFMTMHGDQFDSDLSEKAIFGRVARMWASLVREWHAYYLIKETCESIGIDKSLIIRNDDLDTLKGIDIYLKNISRIDNSIKIDILQSTKRASEFRNKKDLYRVKDHDIPGVKYKIALGENTIPKYTKTINQWFLLNNNAALRIAQYFKKTIE